MGLGRLEVGVRDGESVWAGAEKECTCVYRDREKRMGARESAANCSGGGGGGGDDGADGAADASWEVLVCVCACM